MEKHILKENIKVKGFKKKKNEHKVKQTKNKTEERERDFTHIICGLHQA